MYLHASVQEDSSTCPRLHLLKLLIFLTNFHPRFTTFRDGIKIILSKGNWYAFPAPQTILVSNFIEIGSELICKEVTNRLTKIPTPEFKIHISIGLLRLEWLLITIRLTFRWYYVTFFRWFLVKFFKKPSCGSTHNRRGGVRVWTWTRRKVFVKMTLYRWLSVLSAYPHVKKGWIYVCHVYIYLYTHYTWVKVSDKSQPYFACYFYCFQKFFH